MTTTTIAITEPPPKALTLALPAELADMPDWLLTPAVLRMRDGLSYAEIAATLGTTVEDVSRCVYLAREWALGNRRAG